MQRDSVKAGTARMEPTFFARCPTSLLAATLCKMSCSRLLHALEADHISPSGSFPAICVGFPCQGLHASPNSGLAVPGQAVLTAWEGKESLQTHSKRKGA